MPNQNGGVYGLTILSPIKSKPLGGDSPALAIRKYLEKMPRGAASPFEKVTGTHMCRLVVMEDVVFVGHPAQEEHLHSQYLVFECNFDGDLDSYLTRMAEQIGDEIQAIWSNCVGFPRVKSVAEFVGYMKRCQLTTTFFFADVNNKTVEQTRRALDLREAVAKFIADNQGKPPVDIQGAFAALRTKGGPKRYAAT